MEPGVTIYPRPPSGIIEGAPNNHTPMGRVWLNRSFPLEHISFSSVPRRQATTLLGGLEGGSDMQVLKRLFIAALIMLVGIVHASPVHSDQGTGEGAGAGSQVGSVFATVRVFPLKRVQCAVGVGLAVGTLGATLGHAVNAAGELVKAGCRGPYYASSSDRKGESAPAQSASLGKDSLRAGSFSQQAANFPPPGVTLGSPASGEFSSTRKGSLEMMSFSQEAANFPPPGVTLR